MDEPTVKGVPAEIAVRYMLSSLGAERAAVVVSAHEFCPKPLAVYGFDSDQLWKEPTIQRTILRTLLDERKPVLVADARSHPQYISSESNRSALGVPVPGGGFLYCDHPEPGVFTPEHQRKLEQQAIKLEKKLRIPSTGSSDTWNQLLRAPGVVLSFGFALLMLLFVGFQLLTWEAPVESKPVAVEKRNFPIRIQGKISNFDGELGLPAESKMRIVVVGGEKISLTPADLKLEKSGEFVAEFKSKMAKPPTLLTVKFRVPGRRGYFARVRVVEQVATVPEIRLTRRRSRNDVAQRRRSPQDPSRAERQSLKRLSERLTSKRKRR